MPRAERRRGLCLLAGLLAGCHAAPAGQPEELRVVVWNIHHGRGLDDAVDLARIGDELRALSPDLVLLQEVDVSVRRSGRVDTPAALAAQLGMHPAFERNIRYQGGDYGNAILSRWPIEACDNLHYRMLREGEQRGLLQVQVRAPFGRLCVGCTHLDSRGDDAERMQNAPEILARVASGALDLVGGDFNDTPGSAVHAALGGALVDCWTEGGAGAGETYPAAAPTKRIDWLLRSRAGPWRAAHADVATTAASDHRPTLFVLRRAR